MGPFSLKGLPEDLVANSSSQEASLAAQPRSQLIREPLEALRSRRERGAPGSGHGGRRQGVAGPFRPSGPAPEAPRRRSRNLPAGRDEALERAGEDPLYVKWRCRYTETRSRVAMLRRARSDVVGECALFPRIRAQIGKVVRWWVLSGQRGFHDFREGGAARPRSACICDPSQTQQRRFLCRSPAGGGRAPPVIGSLRNSYAWPEQPRAPSMHDESVKAPSHSTRGREMATLRAGTIGALMGMV